jgi:hypothetical protein
MAKKTGKKQAAGIARRIAGRNVSKGRFRGVRQDPQGEKFMATFRSKHLGYFDKEIEAAKAYDVAADKGLGVTLLDALFGEGLVLRNRDLHPRRKTLQL